MIAFLTIKKTHLGESIEWHLKIIAMYVDGR